MVSYRSDIKPDARAIADLYRIAPLNRPVEDLRRIQSTYESSNLVLTAWNGDHLVGVLRGWTDGAYDGYVCDLAVHPDYQKCKVGRTLLDQARAAGGVNVQFVLRASQIAAEYYKHIGWRQIENGWFYPRSC